jgi:hypothetical protein
MMKTVEPVVTLPAKEVVAEVTPIPITKNVPVVTGMLGEDRGGGDHVR